MNDKKSLKIALLEKQIENLKKDCKEFRYLGLIK